MFVCGQVALTGSQTGQSVAAAASSLHEPSRWWRRPRRAEQEVPGASHAVLLVGNSVLLCRVLRDVPSSRGRAFCRLDMAAVRSMSMSA